MHPWVILKVAVRALRRNVMRSALTALGIIIGVGAVIAMVSIGQGAKSAVESQVASLGQNILTVFPGSATAGATRQGWGTHGSLTPEDAQAIEREVADTMGVSPEVRDRSQILANGMNWNTLVLGTDSDYSEIRSWPIVAGDFFSADHVRGNAKVCVLGRTIVEQLFGDVETVVGQTIRIRNIPVVIVGVLRAKGYTVTGQDQDDIVIIPYTTHLKRFAHHPTLNSILIQAASGNRIPAVQQQVSDLLQQRRQDREPDFVVRNQDELAAAATSTSRTMTLLLGSIAGVSLLVGGIGIMNIMLVSVTERTREIGIRLSVGAHSRDVLFQFVTEATALGMMGGLIGILAGVTAAKLIANVNGWPVAFPPFVLFGAMAFSALIAVVFGFYPALKAARLDPIDALRYE